jgi:hypothetical protein
MIIKKRQRAARKSEAACSGTIASQKPPIGITPEWLWKETRVWDLIECLSRHRHQQSIPGPWFDELRRLLSEQEKRHASERGH